MSNTVIKIENLSKQYRLGVIGAGTLSGDFQRWLHRIQGKEDPFLKIGNENTLNKTAGEHVWALKDINLEVNEGEVLGVIGKNGAGKSTLLKILSRVTGPTTGSVKVKGRIASLLEVGTGFHHELTGKENIFLNGAILGMTKSEIRSKLDEIVEFAGVRKYIDTPVKRYSSGMHVRLAFAVAAHLDPEILIIDEVLAVGDAEFQQKAIGKMKNISQQDGRTVLFVSHNMATIETLCNKAVLLGSGFIKKIDTPENVISTYLKQNTISSNHTWIDSDNNNNAKEISLLSARLIDFAGTSKDTYKNSEEINIEIIIEVKLENIYYKLGIEIIEDGWKKLFCSFHNDLDEKLQLSMGQNIATFKVPRYLLNKGVYTVNILAGIHRVKWVFQHENILSFNINFKIENKLMPVESRPGYLIAPLINCSITK